MHHHFDADPDPTYHFDVDADPDPDYYLIHPDPDFYLIQIRLFTLMRIPEPDPDPSFQIKAQTLS